MACYRRWNKSGELETATYNTLSLFSSSTRLFLCSCSCRPKIMGIWLSFFRWRATARYRFRRVTTLRRSVKSGNSFNHMRQNDVRERFASTVCTTYSNPLCEMSLFPHKVNPNPSDRSGTFCFYRISLTLQCLCNQCHSFITNVVPMQP